MRDTTIVFYYGAEVPRNQMDAPIFNTYNEQLEYFHSASGTYKWTDGSNRWILNNLQFTRISEKVVQINSSAISYGDLKLCNYMAIKNAQDVHWHYAFVDEVEYVSESCTNVTFEVDVIQTFMFGVLFDKPFGNARYAYVERCHSDSDNVGDNIIEEGTAPNKHIKQSVQKVGSDDTTDCVAVDTWLSKKNDTHQVSITDIKNYGNVLYQGIPYAQEVVDFRAVDTYQDFINRLNTMDNDLIISIQCMPKLCAGAYGSQGAAIYDDTTAQTDKKYKNATVEEVDIDMIDLLNDTMDGYVPKNKKLWTSLGCEVVVQTNDGQRITLLPEYMEHDAAQGRDVIRLTGQITGTMVGSASLIFRPTDYAGLNAFNEPFNSEYEKSLILSGYPECQWSRDEYISWKAQNGQSLALKSVVTGVTNALMTGLMIGSGNVMGAAYAGARTVNGIADSYGELIKALNKPDSVGGVPSGDANDFTHDRKMFYCYYKTLNANDAKILDDFLSRNGYAQNQILNVSDQLHNRSNWDYIKTNNITFDDQYTPMNGNYKKQLANIFDRGVRFWWYKNHDLNVGNYGNMSNPIYIAPANS